VTGDLTRTDVLVLATLIEAAVLFGSGITHLARPAALTSALRMHRELPGAVGAVARGPTVTLLGPAECVLAAAALASLAAGGARGVVHTLILATGCCLAGYVLLLARAARGVPCGCGPVPAGASGAAVAPSALLVAAAATALVATTSGPIDVPWEHATTLTAVALTSAACAFVWASAFSAPAREG
jgi:hypothetical protein